MYRQQKVLAIIPARGGSKGIPNKNIIDLCGKPLIAYSITAAKASKYIDDIIVSTDSEKIRNIACEYGAEAPFLRPKELASDESKTIDCMLHAINYLEDIDRNYDYVVLLQPTQPIRRPEFIDNALSVLVDSGKDSLVSICPVTEHPILMRTIDSDGTLRSILNINSTVRRQDFPNIYRVNGSIYINRINEHFNSQTSLNDNILPYHMDAQYSIDIDSPEDLEKAEHIIRKLNLSF